MGNNTKEKWRQAYYGVRPKGLLSREGMSVSVPAIVQEEQRRRLELSHASLTAALMNDPLPGFSALDRKMAGAAV